jgi:ParB/RepB/Spo0J family partition protein
VKRPTEVPFEDIERNPIWHRELDPDFVRRLARSIERHGLLNGDIRGRRRADGKVEIACGHYRVAALWALGRATAPIWIVDLDDLGMILTSAIENFQRDGYTYLEKARLIAMMVNQCGYSPESLAEDFGLSPGRR